MAFERQGNVTGRVLTCTEFCLFCVAQVEITEAGEAVEIPLTFTCLLERKFDSPRTRKQDVIKVAESADAVWWSFPESYLRKDPHAFIDDFC